MTSLRFGGVPEHFNYLWHVALAHGLFESKAKVSLSWRDVLGGTGSMIKKLENNELDVAIMLTEGAAKAIADGMEMKIIGTYVQSPLQWGIHVPGQSSLEKIADLEGKRFAISRKGSGSHLISFLLAEQQGWELDKLQFELVKNFEGAQDSFAKGESEVFLWEKFTTKPTVDIGEFKRVGIIPTPWPCFVMVARSHIANEHQKELLAILDTLRYVLNRVDEAEVLNYITLSYEQKEEDVEEWYKQTSWSVSPHIKRNEMDKVQKALIELGLIETAIPLEQYVANYCQLV